MATVLDPLHRGNIPARPDPTGSDDVLAAALACSDQGVPVVPLFGVVAGRCECRAGADCGKSAGKHNRLTGWQDEATVAPATIRRWWRRWPHANLGMPTGAASWLVVLDPDGQEGADSLARYEAEHGELPATVEAVSGSGEGRHFYYLAPADPAAVGNKVRLLPGVDIRGEGGLVVLPPSRHASGRRYAWVPGRAPGEIDFAPLPKALLAMLRPQEPPRPTWTPPKPPADADRYALAALEAELNAVAAAIPTTRNDTLNRAGYALFRFVPEGRLDRDIVADGLLAAARCCGLTNRDATATIKSAAKARGVTL